jgi:hypothetical protein
LWYVENVKFHLMVKFTLEQATKAQRGSRGIALLSLYLGARWRWVINATPRPLYPRETDPAPLYGTLDGHQGWSGRVLKISPPPGFSVHGTAEKILRTLGLRKISSLLFFT